MLDTFEPFIACACMYVHICVNESGQASWYI